jgi:hypothetical protein
MGLVWEVVARHVLERHFLLLRCLPAPRVPAHLNPEEPPTLGSTIFSGSPDLWGCPLLLPAHLEPTPKSFGLSGWFPFSLCSLGVGLPLPRWSTLGSYLSHRSEAASAFASLGSRCSRVKKGPLLTQRHWPSEPESSSSPMPNLGHVFGCLFLPGVKPASAIVPPTLGCPKSIGLGVGRLGQEVACNRKKHLF